MQTDTKGTAVEPKTYPNVVIVDHPVVQDELARLRHRNTRPREFNASANRIAKILAVLASMDLPTIPTWIPTPLKPAESRILDPDRRIVAVPVLRAGLGIEWGFKDIIPDACSFHHGLVRDERTAEALRYMSKLGPRKLLPTDAVFLLDPMLATGGSAVHTLNEILAAGASVEKIKMLCVVAAPEGVETIRAVKEYDPIVIYTPAIDEGLNEDKFIVPGLGDFGDRLCGTC